MSEARPTTWKALADEVVGRLSETLVGRSRAEVVVETVFWYGAVDIDPRHAVVWLLLSAPREYPLPAWFCPTDGPWSADPQQATLDAEFLSWTRALRDEV